MLKNVFTFALLLSLSLVFAGCPRQPQPNPDDTIIGDGAQSGRSPNFVTTPPPSLGTMERDLFPDEGLFPQDRLGDGERMEGILPSVFFDYDQSFIREDQRPLLAEAYEYLRDNPGNDLLIEGHCDYRGTREYNLALGDRRAASVKTFLTQLGLDADRIQTLSKGDLEAVEGATDAQRAQDRRADLILIR